MAPDDDNRQFTNVLEASEEGLEKSWASIIGQKERLGRTKISILIGLLALIHTFLPHVAEKISCY